MALLVIALVSCLFAVIVSADELAAVKRTEYKPTWESLESRPIPYWYDAAKFGIFIHWGVFAVPARGEWFWFNWKGNNNTADIDYMKNNFKPNFTYQEFGRDFTAEYFSAQEWADLFKNSGAKYVVLTSKHHEGYTLWPSKYSFSWNSVDVGPHRDIVGELGSAVKKEGMVYGLYHSLFEWFNPLYLHDKRNQFKSDIFVTQKTIPELYELVERYEPEVIWSDGEWEASENYWKSKEFIAWLYNSSPVKETVVTNDRWGSSTLCKHGGFLTCADRYNPEQLQKRKWENAMTIDKKTWGYRRNADIADYLTLPQLITSLVKTVSCGGNLLLNVGPTADGRIPPVEQERLIGIGKWLKLNGEAIYNSQPWTVCQNDTMTHGLWYTRGTDNDSHILYAIFFYWPLENSLTLGCLAAPSTSKIVLIGVDEPLKWTSTDVTVIQLPPKPMPDLFEAYPVWTLKITGYY